MISEEDKSTMKKLLAGVKESSLPEKVDVDFWDNFIYNQYEQIVLGKKEVK